MKHKSTKRSHTNKHHERRRSSVSSATIFDPTAIPSKKVDLGTGTVHLDPHSICLRTNTIVKSQKALKRDLLRCSDQRPSLLGPQTLQPPRIHHGSHQGHASGSSTIDRQQPPQQPARRRSLSVNSRTFYATIDRIGPWPDISISRLRSDGNEFLRPLKNFRNLKNPRVFSPKYYAALTENTSKFKFYSSTRNYIDEYRKQKGYLLGARTTIPTASLSLTTRVSIQQTEEDQTSVTGEFSNGGANLNNGTVGDRMILSTTDVSLPVSGPTKSTIDFSDRINASPSMPFMTKVFNEPHHSNGFPIVATRNGHLRQTRHPPHHAFVAQQSQHQQTIALPSVTASSLHYISSMSSVEKAYSNSKKPPAHSQSKLIFIDERHKKKYVFISSCIIEKHIFIFSPNKNRIPQRIHSESEV
jgi:hypothetical protein